MVKNLFKSYILDIIGNSHSEICFLFLHTSTACNAKVFVRLEHESASRKYGYI